MLTVSQLYLCLSLAIRRNAISIYNFTKSDFLVKKKKEIKEKYITHELT